MTDTAKVTPPDRLAPPDESPLDLIREARHQPDRDPTPARDESFGALARGANGTYFDRAAHRAYVSGRRPIVEGVVCGPAAAVVERVRREREAVRDAVRAFERARQAVEAADRADVAEKVAAVAKGRTIDAGRRGREARQALDAADLDAAVKLHLAVEGEEALVRALTEHALAIRERTQGRIDDQRRRLVEAVDRARQLATEVERDEAVLGDFEAAHVAPLVKPDVVIDLRPPEAQKGWSAPIGSPHGVNVADILAGGRTLPRPPRRELDIIAAWAAEVPWATSWRVGPQGVTVGTTEPAGTPPDAEQDTPVPARRRGRPRTTTGTPSGA